MRVIAHGGAGSPPDEPAARQAALEAAAAAGTGTGTPTDAVCTAVRTLEADPWFNAGVGGSVQSDGYVRTDAGLMTDDREAGAACSMPGVAHAVDVARVVKEETPHVLVAGVHAVDLAAAAGVETGVDLWADRTRERWDDLDSYPEGDPLDHAEWVAGRFGGDPDSGRDPAERDPGGGVTDGDGAGGGGAVGSGASGGAAGGAADGDGGDDGAAGGDGPDHDTVGAVATDGDRVAAATSTGGRWLALAGRVGDVPQVGSGFYCSPAGGASATGAGEDIARVTLARRAVDRLEAGRGAQVAAEAAIEEFGDLVEGTAGVILLTPDGDVGEAFNSAAMQTAVAGDP